MAGVAGTDPDEAEVDTDPGAAGVDPPAAGAGPLGGTVGPVARSAPADGLSGATDRSGSAGEVVAVTGRSEAEDTTSVGGRGPNGTVGAPVEPSASTVELRGTGATARNLTFDVPATGIPLEPGRLTATSLGLPASGTSVALVVVGSAGPTAGPVVSRGTAAAAPLSTSLIP